jgi:hypothetical protein
LGEYALGIPGGVNAKIGRDADADRYVTGLPLASGLYLAA